MKRIEIMVQMACAEASSGGEISSVESHADFADLLIAEDAKRSAAQASATNPLYPPPASGGEPPPMEVGADPIIESNIRTLRERAAAGLQTYGTNLTRKDLTRDQWLEHLLHELLDAANYVTRIRMEAETVARPAVNWRCASDRPDDARAILMRGWFMNGEFVVAGTTSNPDWVYLSDIPQII